MNYVFLIDNSNGRIGLGHSGGSFVYNTTTTLATGTWYHVAVTVSSGTAQFYINGVSKDSFTGVTITSTTHDLIIGATVGYNYFGGNIDEASIFNSALSASDITAIYNSGIPNDISSLNPVGWWRMGDNDGGTGTTITDQGSGSNDGTLTNGPTFSTNVPFINAYSVDFDGTNDYMTIGTNTLFDTGSAFSYSGWVKLDSYSNVYQTIAQFKTNHSNGFQLLLSNQSIYQGLNIGSSDNTNMMKVKTDGDISSTFLNWTHIGLTYNGSGGSASANYKIFINGSEIATVATGPYATLSNFNSVGAANNGSTFYVNGLIDEVAIFNSELSASDITNIYNSGEPADLTSYSPVHWWRMGDNDGGTGTTITDQGSGSNNGTLTNGPTFSTNVPS